MQPRTRRRIRRAATAVAVLLLLPVVLAAVLLVLRPAREIVLGRTVDHLRRQLPGELTVDRSDWPSPGTVTLREVLWTADGDTLLHLASVRAEIDLGALRSRDLVVREAEVVGTRIDVPGLTDMLPAADEAAPAADDQKTPFLRAGALPPAPSLAVDRASIVVETIIASEGRVITGLDLNGGLELRRGHDPELRLSFAAADAGGDWAVDELDLAWAPARGEFSGRGRGRAAPHVPVTLSLTGEGPRRFELRLAGAEPATPDRGARLLLRGSLPEHADPRALEIDGEFRTPGLADLAALPTLAETLAEAPALAGLVGAFRARIVWGAAGPEGDLSADFQAPGWCERGRLALGIGDGFAHLDTLAVEAAGLTLAASGEATAERLDFGASLGVRGTEWLRLAAPDAAPLDSLAADLDLIVSGSPESPDLIADLIAGLRVGETRIDRLTAAAEIEDGGAHGAATWAVRAFDLSAAGALEFLRDAASVTVRTSPLLVATGPDAAAMPVDPDRGRVLWRSDGSGLDVEAVRLTGALGELSLDAELGRNEGSFHAVAVWPEFPAALGPFVDPRQLAALRSAWTGAEPWTIDLQADLSDLSTPTPAVAAAATFHLPGPDVFGPALPPALLLDDLGALDGVLRADSRNGRTHADLDLSPTAWIDIGRAVVAASGDTLRLEALDFAALGLALTAVGALEGDVVTAEAALSVPDATILQRFEGVPADIAGRADLIVTAEGSRLRPRVAAKLTASAAGPEFDAPEITGEVHFDGDDLAAAFRAPAGLVFGATRLDTVTATLGGPAPGDGEQRLALRVAGPRGSLGFGAALALDAADPPTWTMTGDTLNVRAEGKGMGLAHPFVLEFEPGSGRLALSDLAMAGDLGDLDASARRDAAGAWAGAVNAELDLRAFDVRLGAREGVIASVRARFDGVDDPDARYRVGAAVIDGADTLAVALADLPGDTAARLSAGEAVPLSAHLDLRGLPLPPAPGAPVVAGREVLITGTADLGGTTAAPAANASASVLATGRPDLSQHRIVMDADLSGDGLAASFSLERGVERLAGGSLSAPGIVTLAPAAFTPDPERPLAASVRADDLKLEEFASLLPVAVGLQGSVAMSLDVAGELRNPGLVGGLTLSDVRVSLPDGSWLTMLGAVDASGTWSRPKVTGNCEITGGVLRLPDPPQLLHPTGGTPVLWRVAGIAVEAPDSVGTAETVSPPPLQNRPAAAAPTVSPDPTVDVKLSIPSGMWLRGQGLEIALAGGLELRSAGGRHDVLGDLNATRGFYRFLGRTFTVEKGEVSFDGGGELDPVLDMSLVTTLDGIVYRVAFGGLLSAPRVTLTSNPEMPEGDIMAMLLFGRPLDELSSDQEGLVQDRAVDLVTAYGTAQLEARLSRQLKVDMVTLRRGGGADQGDALVIGKYLHQKVLLKYEQALDGWSSFIVNMEYFISHHLKLETSVARHSQSAAGLNWSVDY